MKEAQDAEELRHRDSVPTDGLNTTQMQMLKEHLERESEKVIQTKCIKMKEHLELVIQGETGIRPQYTLLYDSPSARMAEAERRITDVDCSQKRSNEQVDQMQRQMAQMQMHIVQLQTNSVATDAMQKQVKRVDEMHKQVKIFALVDGPLTTDTMDVPHLPEYQRDDGGDDGVYNDDNSLSAMPPYNPGSSLDQDNTLAATQDMRTGQMLSNSPDPHQYRPCERQQQQQHHQPDQ